MDPTPFLFLLVAGAAFYFLMIRPGKARQQQQKAMLARLAPGTEIMTTAGIFGTISEVTDDEISVEISPGVSLRMVPAAIARVIDTPVADQPGEEPPLD